MAEKVLIIDDSKTYGFNVEKFEKYNQAKGKIDKICLESTKELLEYYDKQDREVILNVKWKYLESRKK